MGEFVRLTSIAEISRMLGLAKPKHPLITGNFGLLLSWVEGISRGWLRLFSIMCII